MVCFVKCEATMGFLCYPSGRRPAVAAKSGQNMYDLPENRCGATLQLAASSSSLMLVRGVWCT